jgi:hypothetical protein
MPTKPGNASAEAHFCQVGTNTSSYARFFGYGLACFQTPGINDRCTSVLSASAKRPYSGVRGSLSLATHSGTEFDGFARTNTSSSPDELDGVTLWSNGKLLWAFVFGNSTGNATNFSLAVPSAIGSSLFVSYPQPIGQARRFSSGNFAGRQFTAMLAEPSTAPLELRWCTSSDPRRTLAFESLDLEWLQPIV